MIEVNVDENKETGICEIKIKTPTKSIIVYETKNNVSKRITEELSILDY